MSLFSRQFIGRCYSGDGQQRLQKDRQTVVDCVRHLDVLITPTDNTWTHYNGVISNTKQLTLAGSISTFFLLLKRLAAISLLCFGAAGLLTKLCAQYMCQTATFWQRGAAVTSAAHDEAKVTAQ